MKKQISQKSVNSELLAVREICSTPASVGRASKLNPERSRRICERIAKGMSKKDAIKLDGIAENTFYGWIEKGNKPNAKGVYFEFMLAVKRAEMEFELYHLELIAKAASEPGITKTLTTKEMPDGSVYNERKIVSSPRNWKASAFLLGILHPEKYGKVDRKVDNIDNNNKMNIQVNFVGVDDVKALESK